MANLPIKFTADARARFLDVYRVTGQLQRSAQAAGVAPSTVRQHKKDDPEFLAALEEAYEDFRESLENEAMRRALMGWEEPVYQKGEQVGTIRKYDTRLLELMLKRHIPEYKEKHQVDVNVSPGTLAVPTQDSEEDWEKRHAEDATFEEIREEQERDED